MKNKESKKPILIIGPCNTESDEVLHASIKEINKRPYIDFMRLTLWKPRTKPGYEGLGMDGSHFLKIAVSKGVNPGVEVLTPGHAEHVADVVFQENPKANLLLWIGARNQNHFIQREIAQFVAKDERITLMVKNQPWHHKKHWEGIVEHVLAANMPKNRFMICHRGFVPHVPHSPNPHSFRNIPDHEMAMEIRREFQLPMIFDPSHTGGTVENVHKIAKQARKHSYDGWIIEVHPDPKNAKTDAKQQLTWNEFDKLMESIK